MESIKALYSFRGFIYSRVSQEFQSKYRNTILGVFWAVLNPIFLILIYTVIFSHVLESKLSKTGNGFSYGIYLCAGLLTWNFFVELTQRSINIFLDNASLLKKINFPRTSLLIITLFSTSINFLISFALFLVFLLGINCWPGTVIIELIPVIFIQVIFALSLGLILGIFNVFFRDVSHFFSMFIQFWFWLTPIVYPINVLPENVKPFIILNPMYSITTSYQNIFLFGIGPEWSSLIYPSVVSFVLCVIAFFLFKNLFDQIVDEL